MLDNSIEKESESIKRETEKILKSIPFRRIKRWFEKPQFSNHIQVLISIFLPPLRELYFKECKEEINLPSKNELMINPDYFSSKFVITPSGMVWSKVWFSDGEKAYGYSYDFNDYLSFSAKIEAKKNNKNFETLVND